MMLALTPMLLLDEASDAATYAIANDANADAKMPNVARHLGGAYSVLLLPPLLPILHHQKMASVPAKQKMAEMGGAEGLPGASASYPELAEIGGGEGLPGPSASCQEMAGMGAGERVYVPLCLCVCVCVCVSVCVCVCVCVYLCVCARARVHISVRAHVCCAIVYVLQIPAV